MISSVHLFISNQDRCLQKFPNIIHGKDNINGNVYLTNKPRNYAEIPEPNKIKHANRQILPIKFLNPKQQTESGDTSWIPYWPQKHT